MKRSDYNLLKSFYFALAGIGYALCHERNLRIHFTAAILVMYFARYYALTRGESAALLLTLGFVITCEMLNTAIEKTVDLEMPAWNSLAKIAKDVAAGSVLVAGITALAVAGTLFADTAVLQQIREDILRAPLPWLFVLLAALYWIFLPGHSPACKNKYDSGPSSKTGPG